MEAPNLKPVRTREDVHTTRSDKSGWQGLMETFVRRFRNLSFIVFLTPLILACCLSVGLAVAPAMFLFDTLTGLVSLDAPAVIRYVVNGISFALAYFTYGVSLVFIVPAMNFVIPLRVKPFRGPWYSLDSIPWFVHNALTYMVRYTFLEFVTPSPLNILFYRMMGMKVGKGVVINTTNISDPSLITLGDYVTLGGSATVFAHYGQRGYLVIEPVVIEKGANIGLKASVMGGVTIGEGAMIKPHTVLLPKTKVKPGETV